MHNLTIRLLGQPQFWIDGVEVTNFNTRKDCALLIYLAVTGAAHSRETLAGLLWPELPEEKARRNLRHTLSHLQKVIGAQWLTTEHRIGLTQEQPWSVDVQTLRLALKNLRTSPASAPSGYDSAPLDAFEQVLQGYQGEFLQGFHIHDAVHFEEWVIAQREELGLLVLRGLEALVERCLTQGAYDKGLTATRRLLQLEPWSEPVHRWQMQLLAHTGQRAAALAQFEKCRAILATELGVEPERATVALYEQIRAGQMPEMAHPMSRQVQPPTQVAPPVFYGPAFSHNLPGQLTTFIGRADDIRHIRNLLLGTSQRLVTVMGEGGIGKTRLAVAVAQSFVDEVQTQSAQLQPRPSAAASHGQTPRPLFDGIGYIPLAGLTSSQTLVDQLVTAVAKALRVQFSGKQPLLQQLQDYLRDKALLLLFDNVEHLLPLAAEFLVELLQGAPQVKIVATSRHLLNLQAEVVVRLAGLPMPPLQDAATLPAAALLAYSSVALFVERAQRVNSTFRVTPTSLAAIVQICHLVNGLPLALELAATQSRRYTCQQILIALQASYTVLNSTLHDLAPRHRSIRAMLDYSWQFLSPETARLMAACSIFQGTFDGVVVAAILGATLEPLFMLVDQSLLQLLPSDETTAPPRFLLHELIRQYGAAQLQAQPGEADRLHTAHCHYYLTLLIEQSQMFVHDLVALQQMQGETDNLRAAWAWAGTQRQWDLLTASAYPLRQFYDLLSLPHEAERTFDRTIAQVQQFQAEDAVARTTQARLIAHLQIQQAHFCDHLDQVAKAQALTHSAIELGQQLDDHAIQAYAYLYLSTFYGGATDWAGAQQAAEQALVHARTINLVYVEVQSLQNIGCTYLYRGNLLQALDYLHRALALYRAVVTGTTGRNLYMEGMICLDLGISYRIAGDLMQARAYYQQCVDLYHQMSAPLLGTYALSHLSELHLQLGHFGQARVDAEMALAICRSMSNRAAEGTALGYLVYAHYRLGDLAAAEQACQMLWDRIKPLGLIIIRPFAYFVQGELWRSQGQWQAALRAYETAQQEYTATEQMAQVISTQAKIAEVWHQMGNLSKAVAQVEEVLPQLSQPGQNSWLETTTDYLICYQVLVAVRDPRATTILQQGYQRVQMQANRLTDKALRHSYLTNVPANQALVELATQTGMSHEPPY